MENSGTNQQQRDANRFREREEQATAQRSDILQIEYFDSRGKTSSLPIIKDVIDLEQMYSDKIVPMREDGHSIDFAITVQTPKSSLNNITKKFTDKHIKFLMISNSGYAEIMYRQNPPKRVQYEDIDIQDYGASGNLEKVSMILEKVRSDDILNYIIRQADLISASDIHIECARNFVRIRFRVDGALHLIALITHRKYRQLAQSIAVRAGISTTSFNAQTGHLNQAFPPKDGGSEPRILNMRIETVPTLYGQDAVIRLFNLDVELLNLDNLGLEYYERTPIDNVIEHPHGMVLVVGPTGSGKTTTLYSILTKLNSTTKKLMTLEDPVEYGLDGMSQIPVYSREGDSFANKLRAVMRLDPDVIMVGEIRDEDTAKTAIQAATTGHLVLSTFHAYSAAAALARMIDLIGRNPVFTSSIKLVISQRLVRRLDDETKQSFKPDDSIKDFILDKLKSVPQQIFKAPSKKDLVLYKAVPSDKNPFGFKGRTSIIEELIVTPKLQNMLIRDEEIPTTEEIETEATNSGMITMYQAGLIKCLKGETTLEEINSVL
jgi:type II secretory ATPase GspE/PulE/Tfp pilus assembly ATPase PilB-like protein